MVNFRTAEGNWATLRTDKIKTILEVPDYFFQPRGPGKQPHNLDFKGKRRGCINGTPLYFTTCPSKIKTLYNHTER